MVARPAARAMGSQMVLRRMDSRPAKNQTVPMPAMPSAKGSTIWLPNCASSAAMPMAMAMRPAMLMPPAINTKRRVVAMCLMPSRNEVRRVMPSVQQFAAKMPPLKPQHSASTAVVSIWLVMLIWRMSNTVSRLGMSSSAPISQSERRAGAPGPCGE